MFLLERTLKYIPNLWDLKINGEREARLFFLSNKLYIFEVGTNTRFNIYNYKLTRKVLTEAIKTCEEFGGSYKWDE